MARGTDILLNPDTGDLLIDTDGRDIAIGDVTFQNQALVLGANKGDFKEYPLLGVGLTDILSDHEMKGWKREIREQLQAEGFSINQLKLTTTELTLDATYD